MNAKKKLNEKRTRRIARNRAKIFGTAARPRLSVSRTNKNIHAQLIDDMKSHTLAHASSKELKNANEKKTKSDLARSVGELLGKRSVELGIKAAVFDRRGYKYHGRVKALAEGAMNKGLKI
jgi:large subunit ribosomal protein L18